MNVGEVFTFCQFLYNKYLSGSFKPQDFNAALQAVNLDLFNLKVGLPQQYRPGQPIPPVYYEVSRKITDDIKHLRVTSTPIPTVPSGIPIAVVIALPSNYGAFSSMTYPRYIMKRGEQVLKITTIDILTDEDFKDRLESRLLTITPKSPIGNFTNGAWQILPNTVNSVLLTYLRLPIQPVFGFTLNANDEPVYDPGTSTELDWPITCHIEFTIMVCAYFGIYLDDQGRFVKVDARKNKGT